MVHSLWPHDDGSRPYIIGPDENPNGTWLNQFLSKVDGAVDVITYHQYSGFGGDSNLSKQLLTSAFWNKPIQTLTTATPGDRNTTSYSILQAYEAYRSSVNSAAELWVGETAAAWDSGKEGVTNAFVDGFWFVTQLGALARLGVTTQCRQTLVGGAYELLDKTTYQPNPDYYVALLWQQLMGRRVLSISGLSSQPLVKVFAHCSVYPTADTEGAVAVAIVNSNSHDIEIEVGIWNHTGKRLEFHLTGSGDNVLSRSVELNGQVLAMAGNGSLPMLQPLTTVNMSAPLKIRRFSILFSVVPHANAAGCLP